MTSQIPTHDGTDQQASEPCDVDQSMPEGGEGILTAAGSSKLSLLLEEGLAAIEEGEFYEAFMKLRLAYEENPDDVQLRRYLVILQKLSSMAFLIERLESRWQPDLQSEVPPGLVKQAAWIERSLGILSRQLHNDPESFTRATTRLVRRISDTMTKADIVRQVQDAVSKAAGAFSKGNYAEELRWFDAAISLGWKDPAGLRKGCSLIVNAQDAWDRGQHAESMDVLELVPTDERHYAVAQDMIRQIKTEVQEHQFAEELDNAWSVLDWERLSELAGMREALVQPQSVGLREVLLQTEELLQVHAAYLGAIRSRNLAEIALHHAEMKHIISHSQPVPQRYNKLSSWLANEHARLTPQIDARFALLSGKAREAWTAWNEMRLSETEIHSWDDKTDYDGVKEQIHTLGLAYSNCIEAERLAAAVPQRALNNSISSLEVESELSAVCRNALDRARILEAFEDYAVATRIYEILAALPRVEGHEYVEQAERRLENTGRLPLDEI